MHVSGLKVHERLALRGDVVETEHTVSVILSGTVL